MGVAQTLVFQSRRLMKQGESEGQTAESLENETLRYGLRFAVIPPF
jgi:cytochrome c-type biogenesis protein CcmH/NrfF